VTELGRVLASAVINFSVFLVNEETTHRARTGISILVSTPSGEVNIPVVHLQFHVSVGVCKIPSNNEVARFGVLGDARNVEELAGVILDTGEEKQCCILGVLVDIRQDLFS
jgi:hypothetical protein